ncbi:alpha/beta-hydrolase [Athelia psychrophila]|uniref:Alpha/beta-hydrolase n=1 Tax=Athelia psychrophila TaxID=1759441 RepID=A0A166TE54_9AGAM|nr:alpha/beta-hydrolase [Fibularhizoctonia sp. CBS 109695]
MSLCANCIKGVRHEGTPTGTLTKIGGVDVYVATPEGDYAKDKVLLFLPDAFGLQLVNNQLLTDDFGNNGYKTILVDYLAGDPIPPDAFEQPDFNIGEWFVKHPIPSVHEFAVKVIAALKEEGVTKFGATGYCLGGRICFDLAFEDAVQVVVTAHPSLLKSPEDLEKYLSTAKAPLLINSCTVDSQFPLEAQAKADEILGGGKYAPGYERKYFEGCTHGFAVRGDLSDPKIKAGKEGAFKESVSWFNKYL